MNVQAVVGVQEKRHLMVVLPVHGAAVGACVAAWVAAALAGAAVGAAVGAFVGVGVAAAVHAERSRVATEPKAANLDARMRRLLLDARFARPPSRMVQEQFRIVEGRPRRTGSLACG
jgi:hypothetical protein